CPSRKSYPGQSMMQTGQDWCGDDGPGSLDGSSWRRVLAQRQMRARLVVIERIQGQDPSQMPFVEDQHMIQAVAPQRPINRSAYAFCRGDLGDIGRFRIPSPGRDVKASP